VTYIYRRRQQEESKSKGENTKDYNSNLTHPSPIKPNSLELNRRKINGKTKERIIQYLATLSSHFFVLKLMQCDAYL